MCALAERMADAVGAIRIVDTNENLLSEEERNRAALNFSYLLLRYGYVGQL